ncbi:syntaxin binding protein 1 [Cryptotrichosporon argae]
MPLKDLLKARFTTALQSIPAGTWKILITDPHSQALLDTVYSNYDILQQNVTSVEPLYSPRAPMSVDAIYLLTPTSQNVERIIADFADGRRTYKSAHLYFIDGIDDRLADRLTSALGGVLQAFVELYCNFWAEEDRVFSTRTPQSFYTFFGAASSGASGELAMEAFEDDVKVVGKSLLNFLATINENPYIRYYQPTHHAPLGVLASQPSSSLAAPAPAAPTSLRWRSQMQATSSRDTGEYVSKKLAVQLQNDLDAYMAGNPDFATAASSTGRPKGVIFVVDRSIDPAAPFLHEFWYQAMTNDLLDIEDGVRYRYTYTNTVGGKEQKEAILSEKDPVWMSVRHLHMKDAIDRLMTDFGRFAQEHAGFKGGSEVNMNDLKDMLASLPQFQAQREQFSLHLDMAQECMGLFERKKLSLAANVEQCCATGFTAEGKTPKTLVEEMVPLLADRALTSLDKVRIIALYVLFREGVQDEDRRRLFSHARLSITEQDMINNLVHLGVRVIKDPKERPPRGSRIKQKFVQTEGEYELSRFKPAVQVVLEDHVTNKLDQSMFPYMRDAPTEFVNSLRSGGSASLAAPAPSGSLRSARPTWHKAPSARANNTEGKQRLVIFVAGGMTYSEMRQAYTLGHALGKDVFIGSTHVVTPEGFLRDMRAIGRGGIGGHPPNAPPMHEQSPGRPVSSPGQPMSYQKILDYRHWTPWVGPPSLAPPPPPQPAKQATKQPPAALSQAMRGMSELSLSASNGSKTGSLGSLKGKSADGEKKKKGLFGKMNRPRKCGHRLSAVL